MRNALVVLVPLCIGLTSGFIVPSGIQEIQIDDSDNSNFDRTGNKIREIKSQIKTNYKSESSPEFSITKTLSIENKELNELDKDLYIDTNKKDVNINERSFIYINQKTKKPLENHIYLNIIPKERINDNNTDRSYLLNRNNVFEEFPRRFSIDHTYIDKNIADNTLKLGKLVNQRNTLLENETFYYNSKHQDIKNISKEERKYMVSYIKPFFKTYVKNVARLKTVTLKPDDHYDRNIFNKQHLLQGLPDKATYVLGYPERKSSYAIDNPYEKIYLSKENKQNTIDGNDTLQRIVTKAFVEHTLDRKNTSRLDRYGFYYCPDCIKKLKKQNFKNPLFIKKICKCRRDNTLKKQLLT